MGYTITATSKAGLTRKLKNMGFQPYDWTTQIGFDIMPHADGEFWVAHHTYTPSTMSDELMGVGYGIDNVQKLDWTEFSNKHVETFVVYGKKHYN